MGFFLGYACKWTSYTHTHIYNICMSLLLTTWPVKRQSISYKTIRLQTVHSLTLYTNPRVDKVNDLPTTTIANNDNQDEGSLQGQLLPWQWSDMHQCLRTPHFQICEIIYKQYHNQDHITLTTNYKHFFSMDTSLMLGNSKLSTESTGRYVHFDAAWKEI